MANDTELRAIIRAIDATAPGVSSAKRNLGSLESVVNGVASGMIRQVAGITAGFFALDKVIGATMAGIRNADALKDLHAQIRAVDGSATEAGKSLAFFDDAQNRTRRTGDDLAKVYGEMLPQAMSRGFSRERFREVIVELDQFATRVGKMPEEINTAFAQIMGGNARDNNPILRALGLDSESVKTGKVGAEQILDDIRRIAEEGQKMGDDTSSSMAKIQDAILDAFSKGWNDADDATRDGLDRIKGRVTDPEFLAALEKIGGAIRKGITGAADFLSNPQEMIARGISLPFSATPFFGKFMTQGARQAVGGAWDLYKGVSDFSISGYMNRRVGTTDAAGVPGIATKNYDEGFGPTFADAEALKRQADAAKRAAEAAEKQAEAIRERTDALRFEVEILRASNPFQKAEAEYLRDVAEAAREVTPQLRSLAAARAEIIRQGKINAAFGSLVAGGSQEWGSGALAAWYSGAPGVRTVTGDQWHNQFGQAGVDDEYGKIAAVFDQMENDVRAMERAVTRWQDSFRTFSTTVGDAAIDFARTGGENLGKIAASRFTELTAKGFDDIFASLFTPTQGSDGLWYLPGSSKGFETQGAATNAGSSRMAKAQGAFDFAAIGYGAYGAAQGAEGTRTGSLISGAASGATIGSAIPGLGTAAGAIIGAIAGAIGGYLGEQQRQSEYKYGVPVIAGGVASINNPKNLAQYEQMDIISQIQDIYERTRNAGVRMMMTLGANFSSDTFGDISGKFQPNPSANWGKHLQQWMSQGLPDEVMAQMRGQMKSAFGNVGFGGAKFDAMWTSLDKLDPQKMIAILSGLAQGLTDIAKATDFFGAKNPFGGNSSWFTGLLDVRREMNMSFADQVRQQQGDVLSKAGYLDDLVGEDQIALLQQIGQMSLDIRQRERDEMRAILQLQDEFTRRLQDARDKYDLMGMTKKDGTPDYERQAHFYQSKADDALKRIAQAKTKEEVDQANADYYRYIDLIVQAGYAIGPKTGEEYRKWALDQIEKADKASAAKLDELGRAVQKANEDFMAKLQPILDAFATAASDIGTSGGGMKKTWEEFEPIFRDFKNNIVSSNTELEANVVSLTAFRAAMDAATAKLSSSNFSAVTANMRANG